MYTSVMYDDETVQADHINEWNTILMFTDDPLKSTIAYCITHGRYRKRVYHVKCVNQSHWKGSKPLNSFFFFK